MKVILCFVRAFKGFPGAMLVKNLPNKVGEAGDVSSNSGRRKWQATPVFLSRESHGQRNLECYSPWGGKGLDMTEHALTSSFCKYSNMLRVERAPHTHYPNISTSI